MTNQEYRKKMIEKEKASKGITGVDGKENKKKIAMAMRAAQKKS